MTLSEDELTRDDFEQAFLYSRIAEFIRPEQTNLLSGNFKADLEIEDEEGDTQKPNESSMEESKRAGTSQKTTTDKRTEAQSDQILPMKDYPKIGKFMRLLIILLLQVNNKAVCNSDQM